MPIRLIPSPKFLPRKYRERTSDFFGLRGLSYVFQCWSDEHRPKNMLLGGSLSMCSVASPTAVRGSTAMSCSLVRYANEVSLCLLAAYNNEIFWKLLAVILKFYNIGPPGLRAGQQCDCLHLVLACATSTWDPKDSILLRWGSVV